MVYQPLAQSPAGSVTFVIRTPDPAPAVRQAVAAIDPGIPVGKIRKLDDVIAEAGAVRRFQMLLLACFAAMALLLAALGMYGVVSFSVAQRRNEMGIRIALGADYGAIVALVLRGALQPVVTGMLAGLAAAFIVSRLIGSLLFSVVPLDPLVYRLAVILLMAVSIAACWFPARAATRTDPMASLRCD